MYSEAIYPPNLFAQTHLCWCKPQKLNVSKNLEQHKLNNHARKLLTYAQTEEIHAFLCHSARKLIPEEWHQGIIIPLYKGKGSRSDCRSYRGITLLSVPAKVFSHVLLARIRPVLLAHRRQQQSGFTPGRSI